MTDTYDDDAGSEQLDQDQLQPSDNLDDRGVDDFLDEGYSPPERPSHLTRYGDDRETLDERLSEEEPEVWEKPVSEDFVDDGEVGDQRAGRLVDPNDGIGDDVDSELVGEDVGHRRCRGQRRRGRRPHHPGLSAPVTVLRSTRRSSRTRVVCSPSATVSRSTGRSAATRPASRWCSCTAARAVAAPRACGGCSTRSGTGSCSPTSAAAAAARPTPARATTCRPTPPGTWSPISSGSARRGGSPRWQVFGGSWGSALALAYAETHPERVDRAGAARDLHPAARGARLLLQRRRRAALPGPLRAVPRAAGRRGFRGDAIAAYHDLLFDPDPAIHGPAAVAWSTWEAATITLEPDAELIATFAEPAYALAFARIENHYFVHAGWLTEGQLIADAHRLRDIPGVIVQGRYDVATPAVTAWDLHRAWPTADLQIVGDAGHAYSEPGITAALVAATDRFAGS